MQLLSVDEVLSELTCPACDRGDLRAEGPSARCVECGRTFPVDGSVIELTVQDQLNDQHRREIEHNTYDLADDKKVQWIANKDAWGYLHDRLLKESVKAMQALIAGYDPETTLFSLGSGAGFELKVLLGERRFTRVFSSDISPTATAIVPTTLAQRSGRLGLFTSDFSRCPVKRRPGTLGMVFQALHHADDMYGALEALLRRNFDHLIIVEPTTNRFVEVLARFGLARRMEYSGFIPEWIELKRVRSMATRLGFDMTARTWWEFPDFLFPTLVHESKLLSDVVIGSGNAFSSLTNLIKFGSMSAVLFRRVQSGAS